MLIFMIFLIGVRGKDFGDHKTNRFNEGNNVEGKTEILIQVSFKEYQFIWYCSNMIKKFCFDLI